MLIRVDSEAYWLPGWLLGFGSPLPHHQRMLAAYQTHVLNLFMSGPRMVSVNMQIAPYGCEGDVRLHDRVGVYTATPLADAEKLEVKRHVVRVVTCC